MVEVARLSKPKILRQVGEASVHKAKAYLRRDVWSDLRAQGQTIKGRCQGQAPHPYRVEVTFDGDAITGADCSCPVGGGGHCKHVAALLLYYREHPDAFVEVEELESTLERRSKGELVALIRRMIRRVPELELLLDAPLPGYTDPATADDPEPYRRQARAAFEHGGDGWDAASLVAHELDDIVGTGDEFRAQGAYAAAVAVYRGVAEEVLEQFTAYHDDEGDLLGVVADCASGLCQCLEGVPGDSPRRDDLLRALVDLYVADEAHGGLGVSDTIPEALLHQTTPEEHRRIAGWVRAKLPRGESWSDEYLRRSLGSFLLELEADELDDEAYLRLCRETGRAAELVDRLLSLDRLDEALKVVRAAQDHDLLPLADLLVQHGNAQEAEWLVEDRAAGQENGTRLLDWLKGRALERRDKATALKLAGQMFQRQPSLQGYAEMRRLVGAKAWPELRQRLIADLEKSRAAWLLIDIYLQEGEVKAALALLRSDVGRRSGRKLDVARAAEQEFPREALALYREAAEGLIEQRGREAYRAASDHLGKVRELHSRLGEADTWTAYIAGLRERYRPLRALREEMDRAGL
jgi:uncharacterized Zn finger protein